MAIPQRRPARETATTQRGARRIFAASSVTAAGSQIDAGRGRAHGAGLANWIGESVAGVACTELGGEGADLVSPRCCERAETEEILDRAQQRIGVVRASVGGAGGEEGRYQ